MFSYHPTANPEKYSHGYFTANFKRAATTDIERLARCVNTWAWSPAVYKDDYRKTENFIEAHFIGIDIDAGEPTLAQAINNIFCDMAHIIGTTKSHQKHKDNSPACDRYRVILKLDQAITDAEDYRHTIKTYVNRYVENADPACIEPARYFQPCKVVSVNSDGYLIEALKKPAGYDDKLEKYRQRKYRHFKKCLDYPPYLVSILRSKIPPNTCRNNTGFKLGAAFCRLGFSYDEALDEIVHSGCLATLEADELKKCVLNGFNDEMLKGRG